MPAEKHPKSGTTKTPPNPWFGLSMALIGVIAGYSLGLGGNDRTSLNAQVAQVPPPPAAALPPAAAEAGDLPPVDLKNDHVFGEKDAPISVVEYSDFECPFCKRHHPTLQALVDESDGKVNWVYRHYPLSFHPNAEPAALASECVTEQGGNDAFWKFADKLFENHGEWAYEKYVGELGLNTSKFNSCFESKKYSDLIQKQMAGGSAAGVQGTPGNIVVNNTTGETRLVSGAQPLTAFKAAVEDLLN